MARRNKRNSDDLFIALLMSLPWWVPFALAALTYAVLFHFAILGAFLWACIFVFAGLAIPFIKHKRGELLASATGLLAIRQMSWQKFEELVGEAFRRQGYVVVDLGGAKPDGGIDLILHKGTEKIIVQCKHWQTKPVGVAPVRELRGVVAREKAKRGILVTSNIYTEDALAEAAGQPLLELIDGRELLKLIQSVQLETAEPQQRALDVQLPVSAAGVVNQAQAASEEKEPLCPQCGSPMKKRLARRGSNAGNEFWGCSTWPRCEGTRQLQ